MICPKLNVRLNVQNSKTSSSMSSLISNNISKCSLSQISKNSKKSRSSGSFRSLHGSKFGRSVNRFVVKNGGFDTTTTSTVNSRVIPAVFGSNLKNVKLPNVLASVPTEAIRQLGEKLEILDFEFNYVSFWLLDVLAKILKEAQDNDISENHQILFLSWLRFVLRSISISGSEREEMFTFLEDIFIATVSIIKDGKPIPLPEEISIKANNEVSQEISSRMSKVSSALSTVADTTSTKKHSLSLKSNSNNSSKHSKISSRNSSKSSTQKEIESLSPEEKIRENLNMFYTIVEAIYQIFADRYVYKLISSAYSSPVSMTPVDVQIDFHEPKPPKPEPVIPDVSESPRKGKGSITKGAKTKGSKKKGKVKVSLRTSLTNDVQTQKKTKKGEKSTKNLEVGSEPKTKEAKGKKRDQGNKVQKDKGNKSNKEEQVKKDVKSVKSKIKGKVSTEKEKTSVEDKRTSFDERKIILEQRMKLFDRNGDLVSEKGLEQQNKFLLPLSEAVEDDFVKKLLKPLIPEEKEELTEGKPKEKKGKKSSIKSVTKKEKSKKKKK